MALTNDDIPEDTESFMLRLSIAEEDSIIVVIPDEMIISIIDDDCERRALNRITYLKLVHFVCVLHIKLVICCNASNCLLTSFGTEDVFALNTFLIFFLSLQLHSRFLSSCGTSISI